MSDLKHIVWDWNGTLLDDCWLVVESLNGVLRNRSMPEVSTEAYRARFSFPARSYYDTLGFDWRADSYETVSEEFIGAYEKRRLSCRLRPDALDTLARANQAGLTQSILSAYKQETLESIVRSLGIEDVFLRLIGSPDINGGSKVERGRAWMAELPHAPEEVLLIGDTLHDAETAEAMGCACALVEGGYQSAERLRKGHARVFSNLCEALDAFLPTRHSARQAD